MGRRTVAVVTAALGLACGSDGADPTDAVDLSCSLASEDLYSGGVARDGIPALTLPEFVSRGDAGFLDDDQRVVGVALDGVARAYPLGILWWHEIVNDFLGDSAVVVTYCPLTGSSLAFAPTVQGAPRNFGVSGLLYENNLIMFDRTNGSLWSQMLQEGVCGPDQGADLGRIPAMETTWGYWRKLYPSSTVITTDTGWNMPYGVYPYGSYAQLDNAFTLYPSSTFSAARPPKELVLGVNRGDASAAYPFGALESLGEAVALNEVVGDASLLITYKASEFTAMAFERILDGQELTFAVVDSVPVSYRDVETGSTWNRNGEAVEGPLAGARLTPYPEAFTAYWFAWSIFHPATELFDAIP